MKKATKITSFFFCLSACTAQAKPSYSFGDEPRKCKTNADCAVIIVSCHNCDWADSVNNKSLAASQETVRKYCADWKKQKAREADCEKPLGYSKREAICNNNICECRTHP